MNLIRFFLLINICVFTSCASKKDVFYFQDLESTSPNTNFEFLNIKPGDILDIQIKALNPESVLIFQKQNSFAIPQNQIQNRVIDGYLVGDDFTINLPVIGTINTKNKTTQSLAIDIQKALEPYIKNPSVNIRILNFRFSVLGEVSMPGTFTVLEERISIPQALGLAGDLTINGDRNHIILLRDEQDKKVNFVIDMTKSDFIESPYYFLKQNDILYVRPNNARVKSSGVVGDASTLVSILSLAVSLFILIR